MSRHPDNPHGWFYNGMGRLVDGMLPGHQFDINSGHYSNIGQGIAGAVVDNFVPGLGTLGVKLWERNHNTGPYGGSFFDSGTGQTGGFGNGFGNSGFGSSALGGYGGQYGGNMPGLGTSGYGSGNLLAANPYNIDPITGRPLDPNSVHGPQGDGGGGRGANVGSGMTGINSGGNKFSGARFGWGGAGVNSSGGPDYT